jgi:predicted secreted protein
VNAYAIPGRTSAHGNDKPMRIGALLVLLLALGTRAAAAGDAAEVKVLGFSPDGRYFAFEQRGADAAGTYAITMAMEVADNRQVKGGSISYSDDDRARLKKASTTTRRLLRRLKISPRDYMTVSLRGLDVEPFEEASHKSLALPSSWFGPESWLVLQQFKIALHCQNTNTNPVGFGLTLERKNARPIQLSHDVSIPSSRGCPTRYRVVEAHARRLKDGPIVLAVIVQNFAPGFDAKNRNFIAVTARVPAVNTVRVQ